LIGSRSTLLERHAEAVKLFQLETDSDTELETTTGGNINYRDILRQMHRIVKGHQKHSGDDTDSLEGMGGQVTRLTETGDDLLISLKREAIRRIR
jgi:hypothetical protein